MDYKDLIERYWRAETSADEERELRKQLLQQSSLNDEERAARAMLTHARAPQQSVNIQLRHSTPRYWQVAFTAGLCMLAVFITIKFNQTTVYGYHNGEPITTLAEAQYHADRIFANLAQAELPSEEELIQKLFLLNE